LFSGYISFIDQGFSLVRFSHLAMISYGIVKLEYRTQVAKPYIKARVNAKYPNCRLDISGNPVIH